MKSKLFRKINNFGAKSLQKLNLRYYKHRRDGAKQFKPKNLPKSKRMTADLTLENDEKKTGEIPKKHGAKPIFVWKSIDLMMKA